MNKAEIIAELQSVLKTKQEAQAALESLLEGITKALKKGEPVTLTGFGTFKVQRRKARAGRNPRTGETVSIDARNVAKFVPGKALKEAVV